MNVCFDEAAERDSLTVNGVDEAGMLPRISACLDSIAGPGRPFATVTSSCNFPLAAGLASSASAFAALVVAAADALGQSRSVAELASLAGRASGSAARSLYGGFVELNNVADDVDVKTIAMPGDWPLRVVVAVTTTAAKAISSGQAMETSRNTSPFYRRWVDEQPADLATARTAVAGRDFAALAQIAEHNCLKMHSVMWSSRPPSVYWNSATLDCLQTIRNLQRDQLPVFFTIDAGPQVKAVCRADIADDVAGALATTEGVVEVLHSGLGGGARLVAVPC
jgi:diphosphomevalonate decarboxylase